MITGALEIHQVNVGQGDCTLVLSRNMAKVKELLLARASSPGMSAEDNRMLNGVANGDPLHHVPFCLANPNAIAIADTVHAAVLIDGGNDCYGPDVRNYLKKLGAIRNGLLQPQLSLVITHYHDDHQDGLRSLMREPLGADALRAAKAWNVQHPNQPLDTTTEVCRPAVLYRLAQNDPHDKSMGMFNAIADEIRRQAQQDQTGQALWGTTIMSVPRGGLGFAGTLVLAADTPPASADTPGNQVRHDQNGRFTILLPTATGDDRIGIQVLASDQALFTQPGQLEEIANKRARKRTRPISENDRSMVLLVQYGSFRHFLAGDIGGPECNIEADIETPLAAALPTIIGGLPRGHCCTAKLSHHGSRYSNTDPILAALRPQAAVVSTGFRQYFHGHPTQDSIDRSYESGRAVSHFFATEIAARAKGKDFGLTLPGSLHIVGDIVIRPVAPANATSGPHVQNIQVYGTGEQSGLDGDDRYTLRDTAPKNDPTVPAGIYRIGPYDIGCSRV
jgi:beta-lactamase superfamily II metal-dependent hydrolase